MKGTVAVVIGTFGNEGLWSSIAERAADSAKRQTVPVQVITSHADTLQKARNYGAQEAGSEYLVFLDADDELDEHYVEKMLAGTGDIRQPSTLGIVDGVPDSETVLIERKPLLESNYLVIGSMVRRDMFLDAGGFDSYPILEDWDLWIRLVLAGATVGACPDAIYKVHVSPGSRNADIGLHREFYMQIRSRHEAAWRAKFG